jgi:hypothetical protein
MVLFNADGEQVLGNLIRGPRLNLGARVDRFFLLIRFFTLDVRNSMVYVGTVFTARVVTITKIHVAWCRVQIRNVLVDNI